MIYVGQMRFAALMFLYDRFIQDLSMTSYLSFEPQVVVLFLPRTIHILFKVMSLEANSKLSTTFPSIKVTEITEFDRHVIIILHQRGVSKKKSVDRIVKTWHPS